MFKLFESPALSLAGLCILAASCLSGCTMSKLEVLDQDGTTRSYWVHAPASAGANTPLVLVLHGGGNTGQEMEQQTGFSWVSEGEGFTVAYPNGLDKHWNDGLNGGDTDDVGFISAVIDDIATKYGVDPKRVYVTGLTDGGRMALRAACELSGKIAAIAPVGATMPANRVDACAPTSPVSVLFVTGLGGTDGAGDVLSVADSAALWADLDGCPSEPQSVRLPAFTQGGSPLDAQIYSQCTDGTEVASVTVNSDAQSWPILLGLVQNQVGKQGSTLPFGGSVSKQMMASQAIWEFFKVHPKP